MNAVIGTLTVGLVAIMVITGIQSIRDYKDISKVLSGKEIIKLSSSNIESEDIININPLGIEEKDIDGRAEEVDLVSEYNFLEKIAVANNLKISRQMKIYQPEFKGQKHDEYSKFQQNTIIYRANSEEYQTVEMEFSKYELLGDCITIPEENFKESIIQNQNLYLYERVIPSLEENITGQAVFNINGMNFKIEIYNMSHKDFIEIVKTTIEEYKKSF